MLHYRKVHFFGRGVGVDRFMVVIENMLKVFNIGYFESSLKIIVPQLLGMMDSLGISVTKDEKETEREREGSKGPNRERESYFGARHSCV